MKNLKPLVWLSALVLIVAMFAIVACTPSKTIKAPEPNELGVITAEQWKDIYPDIYDSYRMNSSNSDNPSYLTQYPFLATIYNGMGFATSYNEARGHLYTLQDVAATGRPHAAANCLTCKSPEMTALVNSEGIEVYMRPFDEVYALINEPVSCYNCHANNTEGVLEVTAGYLKDALGADISRIDLGLAVCGQCHNEYYFDPVTKATTLPWKGLSNMNPDAILAYYNQINFSDFTNGISGAAMIKVQHPEFETVLGVGSMAATMGNGICDNCHTGIMENDKGEEYTSHFWQSPLTNTALLEAKCRSCHTDLASQVAVIQTNTHDRLVTIGEKLASLHIKIGEAANAGASDALLAQVRSMVRDGQFYYDFVFVENSYGAHNSALTKQLLDKAEKIIDEALALLK